MRIITLQFRSATSNTKSRVYWIRGQSNNLQFRYGRGCAVLCTVPVLTRRRDAPYATIHVLPDSHSSNLVLSQGYKGTGRLSCRFINILASNLQHTHHASPNEIHLLYLYPRPSCVAYPWHTSIRSFYCRRYWSVLRHYVLLVITKWILNVRSTKGV